MTIRLFSRLHIFLTLLSLGLFEVASLTEVRGEGLSTLIPQFEKALNNNRSGELLLKKLIKEGEFASEQISRYSKFKSIFPNARWLIKRSSDLKDGSKTFLIKITGKSQSGLHNYAFESKQLVLLKVEGGKLIGQELLSEESILKSGDSPFPLTLQIPDIVLTGSKYDFDIILEEPLGDAIIAGGLVDIPLENAKDLLSPDIQLLPLYGGGMFKSVKAPIDPGKQIWAALLVHPDGLIAVTKTIKIVADQEDLIAN